MSESQWLEGVGNEVLLLTAVCAAAATGLLFARRQDGQPAARTAAAAAGPVRVTLRLPDRPEEVALTSDGSSSVGTLRAACLARLGGPAGRDLRLIRLGREMEDEELVGELAEGGALVLNGALVEGTRPAGRRQPARDGLPFNSTAMLLVLGLGAVGGVWWLVLTRGLPPLAVGCLVVITGVLGLFAASAAS